MIFFIKNDIKNASESTLIWITFSILFIGLNKELLIWGIIIITLGIIKLLIVYLTYSQHKIWKSTILNILIVENIWLYLILYLF